MKTSRMKVSFNACFWSVLLAAILLTWVLPETAAAKSAYLIANHNIRAFDAWNINPDGTITYQATNILSHALDPGDVAVHDFNDILFISTENWGNPALHSLELYDPVNLVSLGFYDATTPGGGRAEFAGVEVNEDDNRVYAARRGSNQLYELSYNPVTQSLSHVAVHNLAGSEGMMGVGYDDENKVLWVADGYGGAGETNEILAYDVTNFAAGPLVNVKNLSHVPVDCTVDSVRGKVYTVSMSYGASSPGSSNIVSQYDIATGVERTHIISYQGVGVAVDEVTGYLYMTVAPHSGGQWLGQVRVYNPTDWSQIDAHNLPGSPAGIGIGAGYRPLGFSKSDGIDDTTDPNCVCRGDTTTYNICYDNLGNNFAVHNVTIVDNLPPEVDFVSATGGGVYDPVTHTVTWNIGTLPAQDPGGCVQLVVCVKQSASPCSTMTNYATIDSDQTPPETDYDQTRICCYKPMNLSKQDGLGVGDCVWPGEQFTYTICYDNVDNMCDVDNVTIVDTLPSQVTFVSATGGGVYDAVNHTVTWNIGTLLGGAGQQCVQIVAEVKMDDSLYNTTFTNQVTIDGDGPASTTAMLITPVCEAIRPRIDIYPYRFHTGIWVFPVPGNGGTAKTNWIVLGKDYTVYVAVFGDSCFSVMNLHPFSVRFGRTGYEAYRVIGRVLVDIDRDGYLDAIYGFKTSKCGFQVGDPIGVLRARTMNGEHVIGQDLVTVRQ